MVITGTKFSATPEDNEVRIGDIPCDVTASTETTITCDVGTYNLYFENFAAIQPLFLFENVVFFNLGQK